MPLTPRLLSDDEIGLQEAAIKGLGIVAMPGYICNAAVKSGALRRVLPNWIAGDSSNPLEARQQRFKQIQTANSGEDGGERKGRK